MIKKQIWIDSLVIKVGVQLCNLHRIDWTGGDQMKLKDRFFL